LENCSAFALAALLLLFVWNVARSEELPAVSATNGKLEFGAGVLSLPAPMFTGYAAGSLTLPVGQRYGVQLDLGVSTPGLVVSGVLHGFTRDPQSYLIGGAFGVVAMPGAMVYAAGPEGELYLDRWTLEAWGGVAMADRRTPSAARRITPFVTADVSYYPTDNWRFTLGVSLLDGYAAAHAGTEYLLDTPSVPLALTADARIGQDGGVRAMIGLRAYLAPNPKSLIRRHREDDPLDHRLALQSFRSFAAAPSGASPAHHPGKPPPKTDPATPPGTDEPPTPPATDGPGTPPPTDGPSTLPSGEPTSPPGPDDTVTPPEPDDPDEPPAPIDCERGMMWIEGEGCVIFD
jgi:hypothetical protein